MTISLINLSELDGNNGFVLQGIDGSSGLWLSSIRENLSGIAVSSAGDVNGDGIDDILIGAPRADGGAGKSYVVFGRDDGFGSSLDLNRLDGSNGFTITGIDGGIRWHTSRGWISIGGDLSGTAVSSAGDVNGDGIDDILIGAPGADGHAGASYVVFGRDDGFDSSLDLASLDGSNGFTITGIDRSTDWWWPTGGDRSGSALSNAGDVNGDGIDDILIGAPGAGASYVVFGRNDGFDSSLDLASLDGSNGFTIKGIDRRLSDSAVSSAGDVNGDGIDDILIGAPRADSKPGESYVVFGRNSGFDSSLDLASLDGSNGFTITGIAGELSGSAVSSAGDFNGDGIDDILIGAPGENGKAGESYVVFGRNSGFDSTIDLSTLDGINGIVIQRIDSDGSVDLSGTVVSGAGDVNGDGFDDILIGAPEADGGAGESYIVFGFSNNPN